MKNTSKIKSLACSALFGAALLTGCGDPNESATTADNNASAESGKSAPEVKAREDLPVKKSRSRATT